MSEPGTPDDPAARWQRAQDVFHAAADLPADARTAYVREACGDDASLREQVTGMLAADAAGHALLDGGLAMVADRVLAGDAPDADGRAFGPYRVTGVLGEGGMGVVLRARREDLGSEAAIKVLRDATLSPARRERFAFEQRALARLDHPAIARLFDADVLPDGTPWFAMELVEGEPLTDHCRTRGLPVRERLRLFREVCEAVRHAHASAILHRDLKPSNILVRADGRPKLLDFGIARPLEAIDDPALLTRTGMRMMTPAYAAPEQVRGQDLGVYTDVYALGVVLYELLADRLPYDLSGRTPSEAATVLTEQSVRPPSAVAGGRDLDRGAWADLDVLCATAMHRDVARRYRSMDALIADVDHFLAGEPLVARGDAWSYRAGKFLRRHAGAVAAGSAVGALLVGLVTFYTLRLAAERDRAAAQAARTERIQRFMTELLQGGDAEAGPSDTLRVVTLLEKGLRDARELASEPGVRAALERTLGEIFVVRSQLDAADTALTAALRHVPKADIDERVRVMNDLVLLRDVQGRWDEGVAIAREAVALAKRELPPGHPRMTDAIGSLGRVLANRGDAEEGIPLLEEAVRRYAASPQPTPELLVSMTDLANAWYEEGATDRSDSLNRRVLAMSRALHGPRHPHVADDLMNLGISLSRRGAYPAADTLLREALDIQRAWYGARSTEAADAEIQLASNLLFMQRVPEADSLLRGALAAFERAYGPDHPRVATVLTNLANAESWLDRPAEAIRAYERAAAIYRRAYGAHHDRVGVALANLGSYHMRNGNLALAERYFREALVAYDGADPPTHFNVGVTRVKLGRALLKQQRLGEAVEESLAGFRILEPQVDPTNNFLDAARKDLFTAYRALGRTSDALRFRPEMAESLGTR